MFYRGKIKSLISENNFKSMKLFNQNIEINNLKEERNTLQNKCNQLQSNVVLLDQTISKNKELIRKNKNLIKMIQDDKQRELSLQNKIDELNQIIESLTTKTKEDVINNTNGIQDESCNNDNLKLMIDEINKKKVIIIGGHERWQKHMKEKLQNCRYINGNDVNQDYNILSSADVIVYNVSHATHCTDNRIKNKLPYNKKITYLNTSNNVNQSISIIYKAVCNL